MKRLAIISALMLALVACNSDKTVFEGKIIGYNGEFTEFFLIDPVIGEFYEMPLDINEDGTFKLELELKQNEYDAPLFVDKFMFRTCVEKGKKYYAEFDVTTEGLETEFRFIGEGAAENEFTRDFWNGFGIDYGFMSMPRDVKDFASYKKDVDSEVDGLIERLNSIGNPGFAEFYTDALEERRSKYAIYFPYIYLAQTGEIPHDADYDAYLAADPFFGKSEQEVGELLNHMAGTVLVNGAETDLLKTLQIARNISPDWYQFFMTTVFMSRMQYYGAEGIEDAYEYYRSQVTEEGYWSQVEAPYKSASILTPGAEAPEIEFADAEGKKFSLADFKGKALYIDFWASWCKPCCEEIPHLAEIVKTLGNDPDVACISISIDEDERAWKKGLEREQPSWPQYLATESGIQTIAGTYQIASIPRFVLLDKNGRIITVNAPRPSELTAEKLKALVK